MPNPKLAKLDKLLQAAEKITNGEDLPCLTPTERTGSTWTCFQAYRAARLAENQMCHSCAVHFHVQRAGVHLLQFKRNGS